MGSLLTTQQFLELVLPDQGPYCVAFPLKDKYKDGRDGYAHRAYDTIAECVIAAQQMCFGENLNVYFATHGLKQGWVINADTGKRRVSRTHDNMREGRTFFFDLDVGDGGNKYSSREQALASLQRFQFRTQMPEPLIVSSGSGYHVYWLLDRCIPSDQWRAYADRMRWLATHHGMIVDPSRTTDQSSVLRVVGTKNLKPHVQKRVQAMTTGIVSDTDEFVAYLEAITETYTPLATLVRGKPTGNLGTMFDGRVTPPDEVFAICAQMREFRDNMGIIPEPAWFVSIGTMRWVENGEELVHSISSGDPRYDYTETQNKINHWSDKSAPTCEKIALECGNHLCDSCLLKGKGRNPLDIANKQWAIALKPQSTPSSSQLLVGVIPLKYPCPPPFPYTLGNAGVAKSVEDPTQKATIQKIVLPYHLFPIAKFKGTRQEPGYSEWCVTLPLEGQTTFKLDDAWINDGREFATRMMSFGVILTTAVMVQEAKTYMLNYLQTLQKSIVENRSYDHYGWVYEDDGKPSTKYGFVIHERVFDIHTNEFKKAAMANSLKTGGAFMGMDGSFEGHLDALDFFNRPQYRNVQFVYLAGLSVPFYYATGEHGMVVNMHGPSGATKTTSLTALCGQWGNPEQYIINGAPTGATVNARQDRMMMLANLPFGIDELTNQSSEAINELALVSSQGQGRIRLDQRANVKIHRGGIRHSIIFSTSNTSLITLINAINHAGQAAAARVVEITFTKGPKAEKIYADRCLRSLRTNYGWTGPMMLERLLPDHEAIAAAIQDRSDKLTQQWMLEAHERFTGGCCATMYEIAKRTYDLGLHRFDVDEVMAWFEAVQLPRQRQIMETQGQRSNPIEVLGTYVMQFQGESVRIDEDGQGNISGIISIPNARNIAYRYDIHAGEIWIRNDHFQRYCVEKRLDVHAITTHLTKIGVLKASVRKSMFESVPNYPFVRCWCYIVDLKHPKFQATHAQVQTTP